MPTHASTRGPAPPAWPVLLLLAGAPACAPAHAHPTPSSGAVRTEERTVPPFTGISLGGAAVLKVHKGDKYRVSITADEGRLAHVEARVEDGVLELGFDEGGWRGSSGPRPQFEVTTPTLERLDLSGAVSATVDRFAGRTVRIEESGAAKVEAALDYQKVDLDLSGGGEVALKGTASELVVDASGAGHIAASGLATRTIHADLSGAVRAELRASEAIELEASGACQVRYWGKARLTQDISGAAHLEHAGD